MFLTLVKKSDMTRPATVYPVAYLIAEGGKNSYTFSK